MTKLFLIIVLFLALVGELIFATMGFSILLTLPFVHYFLVSKAFKAPFFLVIILALILDVVYGRVVPYTLIAYAIFAYMVCYAGFFKYNNGFSVVAPSIVSVTLVLIPNLLISLPYWQLTFSLVFDAISIYLFALGLNIIVTPFIFIFMDFLCKNLNIPTLSKSRSIDFEPMVLP